MVDLLIHNESKIRKRRSTSLEKSNKGSSKGLFICPTKEAWLTVPNAFTCVNRASQHMYLDQTEIALLKKWMLQFYKAWRHGHYKSKPLSHMFCRSNPPYLWKDGSFWHPPLYGEPNSEFGIPLDYVSVYIRNDSHRHDVYIGINVVDQDKYSPCTPPTVARPMIWIHPQMLSKSAIDTLKTTIAIKLFEE